MKMTIDKARLSTDDPWIRLHVSVLILRLEVNKALKIEWTNQKLDEILKYMKERWKQ